MSKEEITKIELNLIMVRISGILSSVLNAFCVQKQSTLTRIDL